MLDGFAIAGLVMAGLGLAFSPYLRQLLARRQALEGPERWQCRRCGYINREQATWCFGCGETPADEPPQDEPMLRRALVRRPSWRKSDR